MGGAPANVGEVGEQAAVEHWVHGGGVVMHVLAETGTLGRSRDLLAQARHGTARHGTPKISDPAEIDR